MTPALSIYLQAARRAETFLQKDAVASDDVAETARPRGDVLWIHLSAGQPPETAIMVASRVAEERPGTGFVVTADDAAPNGDDLPWLGRPRDLPRSVDAFLAVWRPRVCVWIGGPIWPVLAARAAQSGVSMILANATAAQALRHRGVPARELLGLFRTVVGSTELDASALEKPLRRVPEVVGPLQNSGRPLDYDDAEYRRLSAELGVRPVWFAPRATRREVDILRRAHLIGQGASHRLMLIVEPADAEAASACTLAFGARRSIREIAQADSSVFIADLPDEAGLWYRLASVSFIGGSMSGPEVMADPFAPAALGSAILHGPVTAPFSRHFEVLVAAGATRLVEDPDRLGYAVADTLAPDRAATLAHRAWSVVSEGAQATDYVAETVIGLFDGAD